MKKLEVNFNGRIYCTGEKSFALVYKSTGLLSQFSKVILQRSTTKYLLYLVCEMRFIMKIIIVFVLHAMFSLANLEKILYYLFYAYFSVIR